VLKLMWGRLLNSWDKSDLQCGEMQGMERRERRFTLLGQIQHGVWSFGQTVEMDVYYENGTRARGILCPKKQR
jgi:hypothetical protein